MDIASNEYDTGPKKRIPAWTDRILYVDRPDLIRCVAYNADMGITTSDHRPVYASFEIAIDRANNSSSSFVTLDENNSIANAKLHPQFTSESQVCTIM